MAIILAIVIGFSFGFILQKVGASNPQKIINMLRLKDFHLMKVILLAIGVSNILLFFLMLFEIVDPSHISVKSSYVGVIIGGGIMGLGWAISGFCPGTGLVALGEGRKDAIFFVLGGLVGALAMILSYEKIKDTFLFSDLGGKMTLAVTNAKGVVPFFSSIPGIFVAGVIGLIFIVVAFILPE
ncbi:MAG: YeeE/YedE thiosulfate transporter family protein [Fusobacterium sp. JB019]|nr:YeeE/YedE thiosulfate transporter family protein [Fusobacterium sp. JB020]MDP0506053.1 YeeE/YedE thiosulfate transporter family protein [Fusobacterium sp. JB019]